MANVVVALHTDCFCVLPCARVSSLYSCIHPRLFLHEMVRARVRRVSEVQAGGCRWTKPISCSSSARGRGSAVHLQGCKAVPRCCCSLPVPGRSAGVALSTPPRMEWNAAHASRARVSCIFIGMAKFLRWCIHICMCVYYIFTAVRRPRRRWRIGRVRVAASVRFGVA